MAKSTSLVMLKILKDGHPCCFENLHFFGKLQLNNYHEKNFGTNAQFFSKETHDGAHHKVYGFSLQQIIGLLNKGVLR